MSSSFNRLQADPELRRKYLESVKVATQLKVAMGLKSPYFWLTKCTKTKDEQARMGMDPYRPFPEWPYFKPLFWMLDREPVTYILKSRTVMGSWSVAGWASHKAFTTPATKVVFQSKDETRSLKLMEYVKCLWSQSMPELRQIWRPWKSPENQSYHEFRMANDSHLVSIVGDPDKVRSEHPSIYVQDEAAHMPQGEEALNVAAGTRVPKIIVLSSTQAGWFDDACMSRADGAPMWMDWPTEYWRETKAA